MDVLDRPNRAVSALRARRPTTEPLDDALLVAPVSPPGEHDDLHQALAALPAGQRAVLELTFTFGFAYPEIATILDIPVGTVKSRASAARTTLRAGLNQQEPRP